MFLASIFEIVCSSWLVEKGLYHYNQFECILFMVYSTFWLTSLEILYIQHENLLIGYCIGHTLMFQVHQIDNVITCFLWFDLLSLLKQVELQYQHDYAGISSSIGLTASPIVNFSGVVGNNSLALGTDVSFDTASGNFTKYNAGLSYTNTDLIASLTL